MGSWRSHEAIGGVLTKSSREIMDVLQAYDAVGAHRRIWGHLGGKTGRENEHMSGLVCSGRPMGRSRYAGCFRATPRVNVGKGYSLRRVAERQAPSALRP
jgi:hypothetical protein